MDSTKEQKEQINLLIIQLQNDLANNELKTQWLKLLDNYLIFLIAKLFSNIDLGLQEDLKQTVLMKIDQVTISQYNSEISAFTTFLGTVLNNEFNNLYKKNIKNRQQVSYSAVELNEGLLAYASTMHSNSKFETIDELECDLKIAHAIILNLPLTETGVNYKAFLLLLVRVNLTSIVINEIDNPFDFVEKFFYWDEQKKFLKIKPAHISIIDLWQMIRHAELFYEKRTVLTKIFELWNSNGTPCDFKLDRVLWDQWKSRVKKNLKLVISSEDYNKVIGLLG